MPESQRPLQDATNGVVSALLRFEARLTLWTKFFLAVAGVTGVSFLLALAIKGNPQVLRGTIIRGVIEVAVVGGMAALMSRRAGRVAALATEATELGTLAPPRIELRGVGDELLIIERELREMARDLTLGSRQQDLMAKLTRLMRADGGVQELLDVTVAQVAEDLGAEHVAIIEWVSSQRRIVPRAANQEAANDRVVEAVLARPGLIEEAVRAVGAAQLVPESSELIAFVPLVDDESESLLVVLTHGIEFHHDGLDYLAGVARALQICLLHSLDRSRLLAAETRQRAMIDRVPGILYTQSTDFPPVTTFVSHQAQSMLGTPAREWVGQGDFWASRVHPEDRDRVVEELRASHAAGEKFECEYRIAHAGGDYCWVLDTAVVVEDEGERTYQGIIVDISREKAAEAELAVQQARLQAVVDASPVIIVSVDSKGNNQFVSSAIYATTGWRAADLVGHSAIVHTHPDDVEHVTRGFLDVIAGHRSRDRRTYRFQHADGHWLTLEARGEPMRDADGNVHGVAYALTDVSETVGLSTQLRAAKESAERANIAKSEFLSRMSHELRTPMNAVLGFAQLLELEDLEVDGQESVDQILRAGGHLLNLIDEVLDISRIESGRLNVTLEPVALRDLVGEVLDLLGPAAERQRVDLQVRGDLGGAVLADPQRVKQVVLNVIGNAIKYNHHGGQVVIASAPVEARGPMMRLSVQDTGRGIPADRLTGVFTPFERLGAEETSVEGTGLGLALSQRLIEVMGGVLGVESTVGVGSTFWVDLPRAADVVERKVLGEAVARAPSERALVGRVLYVEDNMSNLRLVERLLGRHPGIDLLSAMQGTIGVQLAHDHRPDVVLLDLNLPDIDGDVVLERLKADPTTANIPVVMVSADATPNQVERLRSLGADGYLTKPIDVAAFLRTLGDLLDGRLAAAREGRPSE